MVVKLQWMWLFLILFVLVPGCGDDKAKPSDRAGTGFSPVVRYFSDTSRLGGDAGLVSLGVLDYDMFNVKTDHLLNDTFGNPDDWATVDHPNVVIEEGALKAVRDAARAGGTVLQVKKGLPCKVRLLPVDGKSTIFSCLRIKLPEGRSIEDYKNLVFLMETTMAPWRDLSNLTSDNYLSIHCDWRLSSDKDGWLELYQAFVPAETARSVVAVLNPECQGLEDSRAIFIDQLAVRLATANEIACSFIESLPEGADPRVVPLSEFSENGEIRDALATATPGELHLPLEPGGKRALRFGLTFPSAGSEGHCPEIKVSVELGEGAIADGESTGQAAAATRKKLYAETIHATEARKSALNWLERVVEVPPTSGPAHLILRSDKVSRVSAAEKMTSVKTTDGKSAVGNSATGKTSTGNSATGNFTDEGNGIVVWGSPALTAIPEPDAKKPLNVVLISIDTLRWDRLGVYGGFHEAGVSPFIDRFATRSIVFDNAVAQAPFTLPSHVSMLSGQYACVHRVQELGNRINTERTPMLAKVLGDAGYMTGAFTAGVLVDHLFGFNQGFDTYMETEPVRDGRIECTLKWLDANKDLPFFLFFHTFAVHCFGYNNADYIDRFDPGCSARIHNYTNTPDWLDWVAHPETHTEEEIACVHNKYMAGVRMADDAVKAVIDHLDKLGIRDRTLIVITSDHGQELLERGVIDHGNSLYEEQIHVPLIIQPPGGIAPRRIPDVVELIDIAPTIFDFLELPHPVSIQGQSLLPFFDPALAHTSDGLAYSEVILRVHSYSLRSRDWKVVHNPDPGMAAPNPYSEYELFHLPDDPAEVNNQKDLPAMKDYIKRLDAVRDSLKKASDAIQGQMVEGQEIDPELMEELRQQGYIR